jgi:hypothetical protein
MPQRNWMDGKTPEEILAIKAKISESMRRRWKDPNYRKEILAVRKEAHSKKRRIKTIIFGS